MNYLWESMVREMDDPWRMFCVKEEEETETRIPTAIQYKGTINVIVKEQKGEQQGRS